MKTIRTVSIITLCAVFIFSIASCVVLTEKDNGHHNGWYKNTNNPHNPQSNKENKSHGNSKE